MGLNNKCVYSSKHVKIFGLKIKIGRNTRTSPPQKKKVYVETVGKMKGIVINMQNKSHHFGLNGNQGFLVGYGIHFPEYRCLLPSKCKIERNIVYDISLSFPLFGDLCVMFIPAFVFFSRGIEVGCDTFTNYNLFFWCCDGFFSRSN